MKLEPKYKSDSNNGNVTFYYSFFWKDYFGVRIPLHAFNLNLNFKLLKPWWLQPSYFDPCSLEIFLHGIPLNYCVRLWKALVEAYWAFRNKWRIPNEHS